ncbi:hypothetical protein DFH08DRAFT_1040956 [Mycena albidolilacea]|uniref:Zn(2)-C6 fungal-type domain-containing protein n=1 Tax=Mycena albidolilacea TaxID=1033008 RepID=A0AAD7EDF1_9AGAR|nr:hypothetical protein DFH08DRAFT_1040956 [Mycena albidolilacea]
MANSTTTAISSSLFATRRRAYVACTGCRQRKIKVSILVDSDELGLPNSQCVKLSAADYTPCTRCTLKGFECEYFAAGENHSPPPLSTLSSEIQIPSPERIYDEARWTLPHTTPPSAGIDSYVGPIRFFPKGSRRHIISTTNYPYKPRHTSASPMLPGTALKIKQPHPPHSSSADLRDVLYGQYSFRNSEFEPDQPMLYYSTDPPYVGSENAEHLDNSLEDQNYRETYPPTNQMLFFAVEIKCVCPPGPCICGADLNG